MCVVLCSSAVVRGQLFTFPVLFEVNKFDLCCLVWRLDRDFSKKTKHESEKSRRVNEKTGLSEVDKVLVGTGFSWESQALRCGKAPLQKYKNWISKALCLKNLSNI